MPEQDQMGKSLQAYQHACDLAQGVSETHRALAQFVCYRLADRAFVTFNARDLGILAQEGAPLWTRLHVYAVFLSGQRVPVTYHNRDE